MTKKRRQKKSLSKLEEPLQQRRTLLCLHILFTKSVLQLTTSGAGYGHDMPVIIKKTKTNKSNVACLVFLDWFKSS